MAASKIAGVVKFRGPKPERKVIKMDEECIEHWEGQPLLSDQLVISDDGGLQWAFAYISNPPEGDYSVPEEAAILRAVRLRLRPTMSWGCKLAKPLSVVNSDPFTHNVRGFSRKNRPFNMGPACRFRTQNTRAASPQPLSWPFKSSATFIRG